MLLGVIKMRTESQIPDAWGSTFPLQNGQLSNDQNVNIHHTPHNFFFISLVLLPSPSFCICMNSLSISHSMQASIAPLLRASDSAPSWCGCSVAILAASRVQEAYIRTSCGELATPPTMIFSQSNEINPVHRHPRQYHTTDYEEHLYLQDGPEHAGSDALSLPLHQTAADRLERALDETRPLCTFSLFADQHTLTWQTRIIITSHLFSVFSLSIYIHYSFVFFQNVFFYSARKH